MSATAATDSHGESTQDSAAENMLAARILLLIAAVLVIAVVIVSVFGLPALGMLGLVGTVVVWAGLLSIMMGN